MYFPAGLALVGPLPECAYRERGSADDAPPSFAVRRISSMNLQLLSCHFLPGEFQMRHVEFISQNRGYARVFEYVGWYPATWRSRYMPLATYCYLSLHTGDELMDFMTANVAVLALTTKFGCFWTFWIIQLMKAKNATVALTIRKK